MRRTVWMAVLAGVLLAGCAQRPGAAGSANLPASKDDVAREIIKAAQLADAPQQLARQYLVRLSQQYGRLVGDLAVFQQGAKEELAQKLRDSFGRFAKQYEELAAQRIDAAKLVDEVLVPLYHQSYSEQELRELLTFYRSATGKKMLEVSGQLNQQAVTQLIAKLEPTLEGIKKEVLAAERAHLTSEAPAATPSATTPAAATPAAATPAAPAKTE